MTLQRVFRAATPDDARRIAEALTRHVDNLVCHTDDGYVAVPCHDRVQIAMAGFLAWGYQLALQDKDIQEEESDGKND